MILQPVISPARRNTFSILSAELQKFRFKKFSKNAIVSGDLETLNTKTAASIRAKIVVTTLTSSLRERTSIIVQPVTKTARRNAFSILSKHTVAKISLGRHFQRAISFPVVLDTAGYKDYGEYPTKHCGDDVDDFASGENVDDLAAGDQPCKKKHTF